MTRLDGRAADEMRPLSFEVGYTKWAEGSVLIQSGDTYVLCNATVSERLPAWLKYGPETHGWLTAEYAMLPRSTRERTEREQRWPKGRTQEIARLIGRSLRMAVNLDELGQRQLIVDCDVLQADGGTRTAAITGGWVAVNLALRGLIAEGAVQPSVIRHQIAAVSAGIVKGRLLLDLAAAEDQGAEVDLNVVMTADERLVEVQGTGEGTAFSRDQLGQLLDLAAGGIERLVSLQREALKNVS